MHDITLSDRIFATVTSFGSTVCNIAVDGATSMGDIVRRVREAMGDEPARMATLTVRNSSQGWSIKRHLNFRPANQRREAQQLLLF